MHNTELSQIVSDAYAAAFDESLWYRWTENLTSRLGAVGTNFLLLNSETETVEKIVVSCGQTAQAVPDYLEGWIAFDPQLRVACDVTRSCIYLDTDHVNLDDRNTADFMSWHRSRHGFDHHMTAVALLDTSPYRVGLSLHRATGAGHTPDHERRKLAAILPEVASAMRLGFQHNEMLEAAFWNGLVVGRADQLAILLDERGRVIRHTDAVAGLLSGKDGLGITQQKLKASRPIDDENLQALIDRARALRSPQSGSMRLRRISGKSPFILICYPLPRASRMFAPAEAAVLMVVIDPGLRPRRPGDLYSQAFRLTHRETEMAVAIMQGHSVESAAALLKLSMPTARTHMRSLFAKTSQNDQQSLIRLLANFH